MKCSACSQNAVFAKPRYCKKHFINYIEKKVQKTIRDYQLLTQDDKIVVATSGGKDSTACLYILSQFYNVEALAIDEGIRGYRDCTLQDVQEFCKKHNIKLTISSLKREFGFTLDQLLQKIGGKPCTACGALRRYMMNTFAKKLKVTKLATGHNLDDEAQSVLMNLFRNQVPILARLGPVTGIVRDSRFIPRVKPLYFCTEKELAIYSYIMDFDIHFVECPYTLDSYRNTIRQTLNEYEAHHPGTKRNIITSFLKMVPELKKRHATVERPQHCRICGEPSAQDVCAVCHLVTKWKTIKAA